MISLLSPAGDLNTSDARVGEFPSLLLVVETSLTDGVPFEGREKNYVNDMSLHLSEKQIHAFPLVVFQSCMVPRKSSFPAVLIKEKASKKHC